MDPISQGALGAALPQALARDPRRLAPVGIAGFLAGMLPDADALIRSSEDPLLFLEYHRQFTHSLVFIPVGGLVAALALYPFLKTRLRFAALLLVTTLGYGTHALLDACTSYGTQLFWPFSNHRVAWNNVSIIDPLFTLPLLALVVLGSWRRHRRWVRMGLAWGLLYLSFGVVQRERAEAAGDLLARSRGHAPLRIDAKPSFGNLLLWKTLYEVDGRFYVDAVRVTTTTTTFEGESAEKLDVPGHLPWLVPGTVQHDDVRRFTWFSDGWVAVLPDPRASGAPYVGDVRYSLVPNEVEPLWGIGLDPSTPDEHVRYLSGRENVRAKQQRFMNMLLGTGAVR